MTARPLDAPPGPVTPWPALWCPGAQVTRADERPPGPPGPGGLAPCPHPGGWQ